MKECVACKEPIRDDAKKCPHCATLQMGAARRGVNEIGKFLLVLVAFIIVAGLLNATCSQSV